MDERRAAQARPEIRQMRPEDTAQLISLKREVFGARETSEAIWRHHYFDVPWGPAPGWVAEVDGEIVAALGLMSRRLLAGPRAGKSAQVTDLMTARKGRGKQTFLRLLIWAAHSTVEKDWTLIYGFPNSRSEGALLQLNVPYRPSFLVPYYLRVLRPSLLPSVERFAKSRWKERLLRAATRAAARMPHLRRPGAAYSIRESAGVPEDADALWEAFSKRLEFANVRDSQYLAWRYQNNPAATYRFLEARGDGVLKGLMVVTERDVSGATYLAVVDWLVLEGTFHPLLERAVHMGRANPRVAGVLIAALPPYSRGLFLHGFIRVPDALSPSRMRFWVHLQWEWGLSASPLQDPKKWHMTMGDSDIV